MLLPASMRSNCIWMPSGHSPQLQAASPPTFFRPFPQPTPGIATVVHSRLNLLQAPVPCSHPSSAYSFTPHIHVSRRFCVVTRLHPSRLWIALMPLSRSYRCAFHRITNVVNHTQLLSRDVFYPGVHIECQWALSSEERRAVIVRDLAAAAAAGDVHAAGACVQARPSLHSPRDVAIKMRF